MNRVSYRTYSTSLFTSITSNFSISLIIKINSSYASICNKYVSNTIIFTWLRHENSFTFHSIFFFFFHNLKFLIELFVHKTFQISLLNIFTCRILIYKQNQISFFMSSHNNIQLIDTLIALSHFTIYISLNS